jgi:6-phosphogluconolactonase (cycloisomerase 2 family)
MQNDSLCFRSLSAIAAVTLLSCVGCSGYSAGASDPATHNTYAYVGLEDGLSQTFSIAQFQVSNGIFTPLNPASSPVDLHFYSVNVDPSGKYLFSAGTQNSLAPGEILQFVIGSDGTLAGNAAPGVATGQLPFDLAFTPNGRFALAVNGGDNTVSSYAMNSTGSLTLVNTVPTGFGPLLTIVDSTGQFAYVASQGQVGSEQSTISEYTISSNGTLTLIVTFDEELPPTAMTLSPNGFLYVSEATPTEDGGLPGAIIEFSVNEANGGLSIVNTYTTVDRVPGPVVFTPGGNYAYVENEDSGTISQFAIDASTGALTQNGADVTSGYTQAHCIVDPSGKFLYLIQNPISAFGINEDGTLAPGVSAGSLGTDVTALTVAIAQH